MNTSNSIPIKANLSEIQINQSNIPSASIPIKSTYSQSHVDSIHRASSLTNCLYNNSGSFGSPYNVPEFFKSSSGSYSLREQITSDEIYTGTITKFSRSKGHGYLTIDLDNLNISTDSNNALSASFASKSSISDSNLIKISSTEKPTKCTTSTEIMLKKVIPNDNNRSNVKQQILNLHNFDDKKDASFKNCPVLSGQFNSNQLNSSIMTLPEKINSQSSNVSESKISEQFSSRSRNCSVSSSRHRLNTSLAQNNLKNFANIIDRPLFFHVGELKSDFVPQDGDKCTFQTITVPPKMDELQATNINIILNESEIGTRKTWRDL